MKRAALIEIIAMLFMILFLYTGISKIMDYTLFKEQIADSPLLEPVAPWIAWVLPKMEIVVAILLFIPSLRLKALYTSLVLMILFLFYVLYIFLFNAHLPCSCGGVLQQLSWKGHIIFNCIFIALAVIAILLERKIKKEMKMGPNFSQQIIQ